MLLTMMTILLTQGKETIVDDIDYATLSQHKWYAMKCRYGVNRWYAARKLPVSIDASRKIVLMHRVIVAAQPHSMIDHVDGDGLNNQRINIRLTDYSRNQHNKAKAAGKSSKYKGVLWNKQRRAWTFNIKRGHIVFRSANFNNEVDAAIGYDLKAIELYGDYASINFPVKLP